MERQRFVVGTVEDFPAGSKKILDVGGRSIGVYNSRGSLYAIQNLCPHALAPLALADPTGTMLPCEPGKFVYGLEGLVLRCGWHNWEYDIRTGESLFNVDRRRVTTFPVAVEDGKVIVTLRPRRATAPEDTVGEALDEAAPPKSS